MSPLEERRRLRYRALDTVAFVARPAVASQAGLDRMQVESLSEGAYAAELVAARLRRRLEGLPTANLFRL